MWQGWGKMERPEEPSSPGDNGRSRPEEQDPLRQGYGKKLIPGNLPERYSNLRRFTIWLAMVLPSAVSVWSQPGQMDYYRLLFAPLMFLYPLAVYLRYVSDHFVSLEFALVLVFMAHWGVMRLTLKYGKKLGVRRALIIPLVVGMLDVALLARVMESLGKS